MRLSGDTGETKRRLGGGTTGGGKKGCWRSGMFDTGGCVSCCEICHLNYHGVIGLGIKDFF